MRRVALVLVLVLVLAFAAFKSSEAPTIVTCGTVSGGQTLTAKGVDWAQKAGSWVHKVATHPEQYRDAGAVKETLDGIFHQVLWFWIKTAFQSMRGEKLDPLIVQLQQDNARAQEAANDSCTPCPTAQTPQDGTDQPTDPRVQFTSSVGSGSQSGSQAVITAASKYPWPLRTAVAIAGAESTYRPTASLTYRGQHMRGLWQINDGAHPDLIGAAGRDWRNPDDNAWMAYQVYKAAGNSWQPWSTYTSGAYKQYLNSALSDSPGAQGQDRGSAAGALPPGQLEDPDQATPTPGCTGSTGGPNARIATWNIRYGNSVTNVRQGMADLSKAADVVGLQEVSPGMRRTLADLKGWAMTTNNTATPIMYSPTRYDLLGQGEVKALHRGTPVEPCSSDDDNDGGPKSIVWAQLKDKQTGTTFYVDNTHMLVCKHNGPRRMAAYNKQMRAVTSLVKQQRASGAAVMTTCDCNDVWGKAQTSVKAMATVGAIANWQTLNGPNTHGHATLDYVWAAGASPSTQKVLNAYGSDHRALVVDFIAAAPNVVASDTTAASVRTVTDPSSHLTYRIPIPSGARGKAINFALDQLGEPYSWGAHGPGSWDCSGLTAGAWKAAGVDIIPQSESQERSIPHVTTAQPGDILWHTGHVQLELGMIGGEHLILEAPRTGLNVRITKQWATTRAVLDPTKMDGAPA